MSTIEKLDSLAKESRQVVQQVIEVWSSEVLFSWRWWLGVILTIITWLLWIKYHKKESRYRLLTAGFFVATISLSLDAMGVQLGFWSYRYEVIPIIPAYVPYNLALIPVVVMSLIQYKPNFSPLKKAIIFGLLTAFIGEPLVVYLDIYKPILWRFYYSIPIYIAIYLIAHWLTLQKEFDNLHSK
jgi:hypothetical protein